MSHTPHVRDAGRSLLWVDEPSAEREERRENSRDFLGNVSSQCTTNVNQTESIRLDSELRGWFKVEPQEKIKKRPARTYKKQPATYPVGKVVKSPPNSLTGSVYHMLIQVGTAGCWTRQYMIHFTGTKPRAFCQLPQCVQQHSTEYFCFIF